MVSDDKNPLNLVIGMWNVDSDLQTIAVIY